jgi:ferrous-iron efflux pump FieF
VMTVSIILTIALVLWQRHVTARTNSRVIKADSLHYIGDLLPNIGAILSLWASALFGLTQIDSVVALGAALMLVVGALGIFRGAWNALMDRAADPELVTLIEDITGNWPGVLGYHDLKTRTAGSLVFINLHIELDGGLTLNEAHRIGDSLEHRLEEAIEGSEVIIHLDPVGPGSGRRAKG